MHGLLSTSRCGRQQRVYRKSFITPFKTRISFFYPTKPKVRADIILMINWIPGRWRISTTIVREAGSPLLNGNDCIRIPHHLAICPQSKREVRVPVPMKLKQSKPCQERRSQAWPHRWRQYALKEHKAGWRGGMTAARAPDVRPTSRPPKRCRGLPQ